MKRKRRRVYQTRLVGCKVMLPGDLVPYSRATRTSAPHAGTCC